MLPVLADAGDAQLLLRDVQEAGSQEPARQETLHVDGGQARVPPSCLGGVQNGPLVQGLLHETTLPSVPTYRHLNHSIARCLLARIPLHKCRTLMPKVSPPHVS